MTSVKPRVPESERQVAQLMGMLFRRVSEAFDMAEWRGLRQSHFRVISGVPEGGISVTELGERVGMTKQGCGQFVTQLVESGHLATEQDPEDRRVRVVRRTPLGQATMERVTAHILAVEEEWAAQVGERRYATFRRVLEDLALGP
jgi:DNA-binding MarR family transcriptional regulator